MKKDEKTFIRSQPLLVKSIDDSCVVIYDDLQADFRKFFYQFFKWLGIGYGIRNEDGTFSFISEEEAKEARQKELGENEATAIAFLKALLSKGTKSSSCYSVFYEDFVGKEKANLTESKKAFLEEIKKDLTLEKIQEKIKNNSQLNKISAEEWLQLGQSGMSIEEIWEKVSKRLVDEDRGLGTKLREALSISCLRPKEHGYCVILTDMVKRSLASCFTKYHNHLEEIEKIKEDTQRKEERADKDVLSEANKLSDILKEKNSGLSKTVLLTAVRLAKEGESGDNPGIELAKLEIVNNNLQHLLSANKKQLLYAWDVIKLNRKLRSKRPSPLIPEFKNDFLVSIGRSSRGGFTMSKNGHDIEFKLGRRGGWGEMTCSPSHYYGDLKITPAKGGKGYPIAFRNKLKIRGKNKHHEEKYGELMEGVVNEVGLKRVNDRFYIYFTYNFTRPNTSFDIQRFFSTSQPNKELIDKLPEEIYVAAVDLNMFNPISIAKAKLSRNGEGKLEALDYGRGDIIDGPKFLATRGKRCGTLRNLKQEISFVKKAIGEYKTTKKSSDHGGLGMSQETLDALETQCPEGNVRYKIQYCIKDIKKRLNQLAYEIRKKGDSNLAELIALLDCKDEFDSLTKSYDRMHLKPGEMLTQATRPKRNAKRTNTRDDINRKIANTIAKDLKGFDNRGVVFIEDFESNTDSDENNDTNRMVRLFNARKILDHLKEALEKRGIGMVEVDKSGTSKTDPITGKTGWRNEYNTNKLLFLENDNTLLEVDCDTAASLNVLLKGLCHSVVPFSFLFRSAKKKAGGKTTERYGKRNTRFLKDMFGTTNVNFFVDENGVVNATKKTPENMVQPNTRVFFHEGLIISKEERSRIQEEIKRLYKSGVKPRKIDLTNPEIESYNNFSHSKMLDCLQLVD